MSDIPYGNRFQQLYLCDYSQSPRVVRFLKFFCYISKILESALCKLDFVRLPRIHSKFCIHRLLYKLEILRPRALVCSLSLTLTLNLCKDWSYL